MSSKSMNQKTWRSGWPLERVLFAMAGTIVLTASILSAVVSPWFLLLTGFVAVNQLLYASVGFCGASLILSRFAGLTPACAADRADASSNPTESLTEVTR